MDDNNLGDFGEEPEFSDAEVEAALHRVSTRGDRHIAHRRTAIASATSVVVVLAVVIGALQASSSKKSDNLAATTTIKTSSTLVTTAGPTTTTIPFRTYALVECQQVALDSGGLENVASDVTAMGVSCQQIIPILREYFDNGSKGQLQGYECRESKPDNETKGVATHPVVCRNNDKFIYFNMPPRKG